jgi:hypothetical protein
MPIVSSIIGWLRAGYPDGVPEVDYLPLFALLGSKLTDEQVQEIADELARDGEPNTAGHIQAAINAVTQERPLAVDIARVSARLAAGGWPLADVRSLYIRTNSGASAHCRGFSPPAASPRPGPCIVWSSCSPWSYAPVSGRFLHTAHQVHAVTAARGVTAPGQDTTPATPAARYADSPR